MTTITCAIAPAMKQILLLQLMTSLCIFIFLTLLFGIDLQIMFALMLIIYTFITLVMRPWFISSMLKTYRYLAPSICEHLRRSIILLLSETIIHPFRHFVGFLHLISMTDWSSQLIGLLLLRQFIILFRFWLVR